MSYRCDDCGFDIWIQVWETATVVLGLYDDARFPGRCILALRAHHEHLDELPEQRFLEFWSAAAVAGRAIRTVTKAARVNYAVLGNTEPHIHAHLIPRYPDEEALPDRPPWEDTRPRQPLGPSKDDLVEALRAELGTHR